MATTIQANVHTLSTNEQAAHAGFTHAFVFGPGTSNPLADDVADDDITFNLFLAPIGSIIVKAALILDPAFSDASDAAFNDCQFSFGDTSNNDAYIDGVQMALNGSEVLHTFENTAAMYSTAYVLTCTVESMTAKILSNLDLGKGVLLFQFLDLNTLTKTQ